MFDPLNENKNGVELNWKGKSVNIGAIPPGHEELILEQERYSPGNGTGEGALYWGDNLDAMKFLLAGGGWEGKIDLIYIDPPFFTGLNFSIRTAGGQRHRAYKDTWANGLPQYLSFMKERLELMYRLLKDSGSIYVHLDWHVAHYVKVLLDEIFGYSSFRNQIVWKRLTYKQTQVKAYGVLHDVILYYTKGSEYTWNDVRAAYDEDKLKKYFCWVETHDGRNIKLKKEQLDTPAIIPDGRRFALNPIINPNPNRPNLTYDFLGFTKVWKYTKEKMLDYYQKGIVFQPSKTAAPQKKQYLDESKGMKLNDIFLDIGGVMGGSNERIDFDTQKPLKLLKRLIAVSSNPGDVVADFFCGSGTTLVASQELGRRWIGSEISWLGIHSTKKRLLECCGLNGKSGSNSGFSVYDLKKKQDRDGTTGRDQYIAFTLATYRAEQASPQEDSGNIHGMKDGRAVHVHAAPEPPTIQQLLDLAGTIKARGIDAIDVLSEKWIFPVDWNPSDIARECKCDLRCIRTPSIHDMEATLIGVSHPPDAHTRPEKIDAVFFIQEMDIFLDIIIKDREASINLRMIGNDGPPPSEIIDVISVDWMHDGKVFSPIFNVVKTKDSKEMPLTASFIYPEKGTFTVLIHITDVHCHVARRFAKITIR